jgi:hypothetical protein
LSFKFKYSSSLKFQLKFVIQVHSYILKLENHGGGAPEQRWVGQAWGMEAGADVEEERRPGVVADRSGAFEQ